MSNQQKSPWWCAGISDGALLVNMHVTLCSVVLRADAVVGAVRYHAPFAGDVLLSVSLLDASLAHTNF